MVSSSPYRTIESRTADCSSANARWMPPAFSSASRSASISPGRRVDVGDRLGHDEDPGGRRVERLDEIADPVAELVGVGEEQRGRPADDEQPRDLLGVRVAQDVVVAADAGTLAEHRRVRRPGTLEDVDRREGDGDDDPLEDADERHAERAGEGKDEFGPPNVVEPAQLGDVEQADRRRDDDGREDRLGHRLDEARRNEQHQQHERGGDEAGQLRLRPRLVRDRRPGAARAHREAGEQAGRQVGRPDPGELLVAIDLVAADGWRSRLTSRSCRRSRRARSRRRSASRSGMSDDRRCRQGGHREPLRQDADDGHPARGEVEHDREPDRGHDGDEDARRRAARAAGDPG